MRRLRPTPWLLAAAVLAAGCGGGGTEDVFPQPDTPPGQAMTSAEWAMAREVFTEVNARRATLGVLPLIWDERVADAAYDHCVDMRLRGFYGHVNPDGLGPCDRLLARDIAMTSCGAENIARGERTAGDVLVAWFGSSSHSQPMLSGAWTHVGVGVHAGAEGPWWTMDFYTLVDL